MFSGVAEQGYTMLHGKSQFIEGLNTKVIGFLME